MEKSVVSSWIWVGGGSADKSHYSGELHKEDVGSVRPEGFSGGPESFGFSPEQLKEANKQEKKSTGTLMCTLIVILLSQVGLIFLKCLKQN